MPRFSELGIEINLIMQSAYKTPLQSLAHTSRESQIKDYDRELYKAAH